MEILGFPISYGMHHTTYRKEKLPELLKRLSAEFIEREWGFPSLITVTAANISDSQKNVEILYTVLPETDEKVVKFFLDKKIGDFLKFIDSHARIGRMPEIKFLLDLGEKNRQRIDEISQMTNHQDSLPK